MGSHGRWKAPAFKQPTCPYDIESGAGGLTREVETPFKPPPNATRCHSSLNTIPYHHARQCYSRLGVATQL